MIPVLSTVFQVGVGFSVGALLAGLLLVRKRQADLVRIASLEIELAAARKSMADQTEFLAQTQQRFSQTFQALSAEALRANNRAFLDLAQSAITSFQTEVRTDAIQRQGAMQQFADRLEGSLRQVDSRINDLEKARADAYGSLTAQVRGLMETQNELRKEAGQLSRALRAPNVRGRWGEVQLRRVVELAGMLAHCDFYEQETSEAEVGKQRPDMIVRMPGSRAIAIDAKAVLSAYIESLEAGEETRRQALLLRHAQHVRSRIEDLGRKAYWEQLQPAPEFVVLFLPGEVFFSAALENDPSLIEFAAERRVVLATPTTLIALLKTVHHGWQQENVEKHAEAIHRLGRELHKRLADCATHLVAMGRNLTQTVSAYNKAVGCIESRVLVSARKFGELNGAGALNDVPDLIPVELAPRTPQAPELTISESPESLS